MIGKEYFGEEINRIYLSLRARFLDGFILTLDKGLKQRGNLAYSRLDPLLGPEKTKIPSKNTFLHNQAPF